MEEIILIFDNWQKLESWILNSTLQNTYTCKRDMWNTIFELHMKFLQNWSYLRFQRKFQVILKTQYKIMFSDLHEIKLESNKAKSFLIVWLKNFKWIPK
jgi:hypothetical protein